MRRLRLIVRLFGVAAILLWGCFQVALFFGREDKAKRQWRIRRWSRQCMRIFGIRLTVHGSERFFAEGGQFMVGNHVSWLDIFLINSVQAVRFVAKQEVRDWPVIGWLVARVDTVFIKRGSRQSSQQVMEVLLQILAEKDYAVVFPEGTSTDGTGIKPFKSGLFDTAVVGNQAVWPVLSYYPNADGSPNINMAYYGEMSLWQSFCRILPQRGSEAVLYFLEPIAPQGKTRQELCAVAQAQIAAKLAELRGVPPESVVAEKGAVFEHTA
ncbi:acyl-phosphate glycerol 3-phosphate acyltransferase [Eikenella longinqua]|uniref:Acyl-phosphate glycerol 3-phosphate acyltransferase n=1 Tax=Eikenella longinqua TaxID=1795827 RepID=A0A1A9S0Z3_9NEIS|nr:lysophospholipid acyltransferase family protein [Eikenella longinqua]OAM31081.1 acyl-phosphate glycerol 3-phosphate acyltransferase [Eikenella longinqua]